MRTLRDQRSREVLSALLDKEIERNEQLEADNLQLEQQQRQLLALLQARPAKPMVNESTFEASRVPDPAQTDLLRLIAEKDAEMGRMRDYYSAVIEKLEQQHREEMEQQMEEVTQLGGEIEQLRRERKQREHSEKMGKQGKGQGQNQIEESGMREEMSRLRTEHQSMRQEVVRLRAEQQSLHEVVLRSSEKVRELSQQLIAAEQREGTVKELLEKARQWGGEAEKRSRQLESEIETVRMQVKRDSEDKIRNLQKEHEDRVNFLVVREQEAKAELKQQYLEEAKVCIMTELEKQAQQLAHTQNELTRAQKEIQSVTQQQASSRQLIAHLEQDLALTKKQQAAIENELKRTKSQQLKAEELYEHQHENVQFLEETSQKLAQEIKQQQEAVTKLENQTKRSEQLLKKTAGELQQAKSREIALHEELALVKSQCEMKGDEVDRLNTKILKEAERRDKLQIEAKRIVKQQEQEIEQLRAEAAQLQQANLTETAHLEEQLREAKSALAKMTEERNKGQRQNKKIREEVQTMEEKVKSSFLQLEKRASEANKQVAQQQEISQSLFSEKENYRKVYEANAAELAKARDKIGRQEQKHQQMASHLSNCHQEIECLKQAIAQQAASPQEKMELEQVRQELLELRAKVGVQQDGLTRVKRENSQLARDTITLHEENSQLRKERQRGDNKLAELIKGKASLEEEVRRLQNSLDERCRKMEQEMPYINTVIEQKKTAEAKLLKFENELKRKDQLLEVAKRSKAEELLNLQKQCSTLRKREEKMINQMEELKAAVEQMNREKVNSYREVTSREDYIHRIEKENKQLKVELKRMESTCNEQGEQLQKLYSMLNTLQQNPHP